MIVFEDVTKDYKGGNHALKHVNLRIRKGDFVFVLGHSGAGKSTFIKLILREEQATSGRVLVDGLDLSVMKKRKVPYLRRRMGVVFQDFRLIPTMSVYENVAFAMRVTNIAEDKIKKRVPYVLGLVGLADRPTGCRMRFRAVSSSALLWPARWYIARSSSLRTSPPATLTPS